MNKFIGILMMALLSAGMYSCSDDDVLTPLEKSEITNKDATYNSLTFRWGKVKDARQYSYQLTKTGSEDILTTGVTKETTLYIAGLEHDTEYTLTVLAYAAMNSANTTSEPIVINARTADLTTLDTPEISWSREVNTIIFTWPAVTGARDYAYSLTDAEGNSLGEGSTYDTYVSFTNMQNGTYTFTVVAQTATEGFRNSKAGQVTAEFVREREELWRTSATYSSALLGKSWPVELVAYDDNSYQLLGWFGVSGYNFDFTIDQTDANNMFKPDASYPYDSATDSYKVPTGLDNPANVSVIASGNQSAFEGAAGSGSITLRVSDGSKTVNDEVVWGVSIKDFVGTWNLDFAAYDSTSSDYDEFYTGQVEVTLGTAENTLLLPLPPYMGYLWGNGVGTLNVDMSTLTFTMEPLSFNYAGYVYILAGPTSDSDQLTGRITENGIIFDSIQIWCLGYTYLLDTSYLKYTR